HRRRASRGWSECHLVRVVKTFRERGGRLVGVRNEPSCPRPLSSTRPLAAVRAAKSVGFWRPQSISCPISRTVFVLREIEGLSNGGDRRMPEAHQRTGEGEFASGENPFP